MIRKCFNKDQQVKADFLVPHFKDGEFISCMFQYKDCLEYITPKNIVTRIIRPEGGTILDVELDIDGFFN